LKLGSKGGRWKINRERQTELKEKDGGKGEGLRMEKYG
jgi:hypothetical protein